jgi:TRAP-type C4-dicarboxylate transport system permease small subunit
VRGVEVEMRTIAIVILAAGILALAYGGFSYTRETHDAKIGPLSISVSENRRVNVPVWAGVVLAVVGGGLLVAGKK